MRRVSKEEAEFLDAAKETGQQLKGCLPTFNLSTLTSGIIAGVIYYQQSQQGNDPNYYALVAIFFPISWLFLSIKRL